ncbi:zinc finger, CCHC-type containing protein [Tanacetum coccineum]
MVVAAVKHMASNFVKLDKFEGVDFRRWQKKMHFLLSSMSVVYVLTTPIPEDGEDATVEQLRKRAKWDSDDYVCRGLMLKDMSDPLFDIYQNIKSREELCDSLEVKYMAEDASSKKLLISNFINYKKIDSRPVMEQYNELLEELTLVELGSHLRIEESLRVQESDKLKGNNVVGLQLNIVNDIGNSAFMSTFKLNDSILWHARLDHIHFTRMQDMSKDGLIPAFDMDTKKCKTCMLTKITKKPFQNIKRETKVLELIHSDLCDLHATPSLGNKKYFVIFIDDASRVSSTSKSSCIKNKEVEVEDHHRNLLLSKNKKHMSSECNNIKLAIRNDKSEIVCAMCKQCLITSNHDVCVLNYMNVMNSRVNNFNANVSNTANKKKHKPKVKKPKKLGSKERLVSPKPSEPRNCLRWSPTRKMFDLKGKIVVSSESTCQSDSSKGDYACTSNPKETTRKRFPNSIFSLAGRSNLFMARRLGMLKACDRKSEASYKFCLEVSGNGSL